MTKSAKFDVCEMVTERIMEKVRETGKLPWQKPWQSIHYQNAISGHKYRGVNVLLLALLGKDTHYVTFNQARHAGGSIRKGAKSLPIVFWSIIKKEKDGDEKKFMFARYYSVFPLTDVEGATIERKGVVTIAFKPLEMAEKIAAACEVPITHGGNVAGYHPETHTICMPRPETFKSVEHYYATLFHEISHAMAKETGEDIASGFGSEPYAKEELAAEMGANFLMSYCGIDSETVCDNSAAYLSGWMSRIASEPKLLISAAGKAQRRFDKILEKLGVKAPAETEETELKEAA